MNSLNQSQTAASPISPMQRNHTN